MCRQIWWDWEECRMTARDGGVVTGGGDGSDMGTVTEGKK